MPQSLDEPARLRALAQSGLMDSAPEAAFDHLTQLASRLLGTPVSLVSLVDDRRQFFKSRVGLDASETPLSHSFCQHVVTAQAPLVVADARVDRRVAENLAACDLNVIAYLGVPLTLSDGHTLGSLCAIDHVPRAWEENDRLLLEGLAQAVVREIELRSLGAELAERQRELQDSAEHLALTLENAPIGMAVVSLDGGFEQVNRALCEITGYAADDLRALTFQDITHPDDLGADLELVGRLLAGAIPSYDMEKRYIRRDGSEIWVRLSAALARDATGEPRYFIAQVQDISERRAAQTELQASERLLAEVFEHAPIGMALLTIDGDWIQINRALCEMSGYTREALLARRLQDITHPEDVRIDFALAAECLSGMRDGYEIEKRFLDKDGRTVLTEMAVTLVRDETGAPSFFMAQLQDITAARATQAALADSEALLSAVIDNAPAGITVHDLNGRYRRGNRYAADILGVAAADMPGRAAEDFFSPDAAREIREHDALVLERGTPLAQELAVTRPNGEPCTYQVLKYPIRDHDGALIGLGSFSLDVTARRRAELELRQSERKLREAQHLARVGSWDYEPTRDRPWQWSDEVWRMLALEPREGAPSLPEFLAMIHPDDRDRVAVRLAAATGRDESVVEEFSMVAADGRELRVAFYANATRDEGGRLTSVHGTIQDITERANREREEVAVREIAQLVAEAPGAAAVFERVASEVCSLVKGHSGVVVRFDEARGRGVFVNAYAPGGIDLAGTELDLDGTSAPAAVYRTGRASRTGGARSTGLDPGVADVMAQISDAVAAPITVGGRLWGCLAAGFSQGLAPADTELRLSRFAELVGMAIANAEAWDALSRQAATDPLTGLANHGTFQERLAAEVQRARRYGRHLSLVLLDLDRFKSVNDTHGHQVGDKVLVELARRLTAQVRDGELVARIGGEEFAWLMPETDGDAAYLAAERIRTAIAAEPFAHIGRLTISAGVCAGEHGLEGEDLVRFADRALYRAKGSGRNTTCLYAPDALPALIHRDTL